MSAVKAPNNNDIVIVDTPYIIYQILQRNELAEAIMQISDRYTVPFLDFLKEHRDDRMRPRTSSVSDWQRQCAEHRKSAELDVEVLEGPWHGCEWLEPLRRTVDLWYPFLEQARREEMPGLLFTLCRPKTLIETVI